MINTISANIMSIWSMHFVAIVISWFVKFGNDRITTTYITGVHIQYSVLLPCAKTKAVFVKYQLISVSCKKYFKLCYSIIIHVLWLEYMKNNRKRKYNLKKYVTSHKTKIHIVMFIVPYTERPKVIPIYI
jgi:hypothetical protein